MPAPEGLPTRRSLDDWLQQLQLLNPDRIELGLKRVGEVWRNLGEPRPGARRVVVAGTNGKGSCIETLRRLGEARGLRVGCYSSPHLQRFNERIRLPCGEVDDHSACAAFEAVERARGGVHLSWFEYTTLAALLVLQRADLDLALLETGMGGRLDAVNLIDGDLAVVTGVALDHCQWLGPDREAIAAEKAAVYRAGRPAVCGDADPPQSLLRQIEALGARPLLCGQQYDWRAEADCWQLRVGERHWRKLPLPELPLPPCAAGLCAFVQLFPDTTEAEVRTALTDLSLPGRTQLLPGRPALLLDVAHNPQAVEHLAERVAATLPPGGQPHWVFGLTADREVDSLIEPLRQLGGLWYPVCADNRRATDFAVLARQLGRAGRQVRLLADGQVAAGLRAALDAAAAEDLVVVFGSFCVVGEALDSLARGFGLAP